MMFKEVIENEDETRELDEKAQKYGYATIVSLESVSIATSRVVVIIWRKNMRVRVKKCIYYKDAEDRNYV